MPAVHQNQVRVRDSGVHLFGQLKWCGPVGSAVQDQRRRLDLGEPVGAVESGTGVELGAHCAAGLGMLTA
ncbi:MAG TPA: hypothetical protein VLL08_01845 [Kineosporiaceae bacterium]|nr:hypothetical protein [Kineosporiaceae bacterium]